MREMEIRVTDHAIVRWRERGAQYGDETAHDIIRAVRRAVPMEANQIPRVFATFGQDSAEYLYDRESDGFFVLRRKGPRIGVVITYFRIPAVTTVISPGPEAPSFVDELPEFDSRTDESQWLQVQRNLTNKHLKHAGGEERTRALAYLDRLIGWTNSGKARWKARRARIQAST